MLNTYEIFSLLTNFKVRSQRTVLTSIVKMEDLSTPSADSKVSLPTFDGSRTKYQVWWVRFSAYAQLRKFKAAFEKEDDLPSSEDAEIDLTKDEGKKQMAAKSRNDLAIALFTLAFTTDSLLAIISGSQDNDWPGGRAWTVVEVLKARYRPDDVLAQSELRAKLFKVSMNVTDHPEVLFNKIEVIKAEHTTPSFQVQESDLISAIIAAAPKERYGTMLAAEMSNPSLTVEMLKSKMEETFRVFGIGAMISGGSGSKPSDFDNVDQCRRSEMLSFLLG